MAPTADIDSLAPTLSNIEEEAVIYIEDRLTVVQLKREAVINLNWAISRRAIKEGSKVTNLNWVISRRAIKEGSKVINLNWVISLLAIKE